MSYLLNKEILKSYKNLKKSKDINSKHNEILCCISGIRSMVEEFITYNGTTITTNYGIGEADYLSIDISRLFELNDDFEYQNIKDLFSFTYKDGKITHYCFGESGKLYDAMFNLAPYRHNNISIFEENIILKEATHTIREYIDGIDNNEFKDFEEYSNKLEILDDMIETIIQNCKEIDKIIDSYFIISKYIEKRIKGIKPHKKVKTY